ncbi:MAG: hypothetical protein IRZ04_14150 [Rhodospirillales bacterium]|nr:hypothetical protein [Rhodospirillales bacterium]
MDRRIAPAALDGSAARVAAAVLAVAVAGLAVWVHRHELFPEPAAETVEAGPDPFEACMASRSADIDRMLAEKSIDAERAGLFRARAEAMCRAEADKAAGKAPGLPPGLRPTQNF